ncbi:MAG: tol-pal system-associated acyl-CoA thioesterase [Gammaproteobacteria bacterium]|nr:MAG: tol-pal system-associated acyl-CoA thioesterase [Gammaproteobacteria bacterium]
MKKFSIKIRVYYEDTDAGGVVYYANYLKFYERARTEYLRHMGYNQDQLKNKYDTIFVVRSITVDYLKPAKLDELLLVDVTIVESRKASFTIEQKIKRLNDIISCATVRIACVSNSKLKPKKIPFKELIRL